MRVRSDVHAWLTDMDGVLVHEEQALPGAQELIEQWTRSETPFLVLTNNSTFTPRDLSARLRDSGLVVPEDHIWTSALATATFLEQQQPGASVYVIGEAGTITALHEAGFVLTDRNPDFVVIGETRTYSFESITRAIRLIDAGARFIITNPDATGPSTDGVLPATGAIAALISEATQEALRGGQTQPDDVPLRPEPPRRAQRAHGHDRRPDGHRHRRRDGGRAAHNPGAHRDLHPRVRQEVPLPAQRDRRGRARAGR